MNSFEQCLWDELLRIESKISEEEEKVDELESWIDDLLRSAVENETRVTCARSSSRQRVRRPVVDCDGHVVADETPERQHDFLDPSVDVFRAGANLFVLVRIAAGEIVSFAEKSFPEQSGILDTKSKRFCWMRLTTSQVDIPNLNSIHLLLIYRLRQTRILSFPSFFR